MEIFSTSPIQSTSGGSLVTIAMHMRESMPAGTLASPACLQIVPYVDPAGGMHIYQTQVSDAQGAFEIVELPADREGRADEGHVWLIGHAPQQPPRQPMP